MGGYAKNKAWLYGLLAECPFDPEKSEGCQLCAIRKKTLAERVEWADSLSEKEVENIIKVHKACLWKKENG